MSVSVPPSVIDVVGPREHWEPVGSSDHVWFAGDLVVKRGAPGQATVEADRLTWLGGRIGGPAVRLVSDDGGPAWLVTERLAGHPARRVDMHGDVGGITTTIARAIRTLHETAVESASFPFGSGWDDLAADVRHRGERLDTSTLPDPYRRYDAGRLVEIWLDGRPTVEELVLCHGRPTLDDLVVDPAFVGWVDVGGLRLADRHADLAIIQYSIHRHFGPDSVFAFFEAYELDVDLVRLDHYLLASFLMRPPT